MFLQPGVLQSAVLTTRGPEIRGSYNQGFLQLGALHPEVLQPGVLISSGSYKHGSYNQGFLQPGVFTYRGLTATGSYSQGSYIREFLQPGISHLGVLTSGSDTDFAYLLHRGVNRYANWAFTTFAQIYSPVCTNLHHFCAEQIWNKSIFSSSVIS